MGGLRNPLQEFEVGQMFGENQRGGEDHAQISVQRVSETPCKGLVQRSDGLQLLAPNLPRPAHIRELNMRLRRRLGVGPAAAARHPYQGIDILPV